MIPEHVAPTLDTETTLKRLGGDQELLLELYTAFADDAIVKLQSLQKAVAEQNTSNIQKRAHSLKGSSSAIGAMLCHELAATIEIAAQENDHAQLGTLLPQIENEIHSLIQFIQQKK